MLILGLKGANLDQKGPKMGGTRFSPELSLGYFINRPKMQFKYAKLRRSYDSEKLAEMSILGQKGHFGYQLAQNGPNGIFWAKKRQIWTKKGPKWAWLYFSRTVNLNFSKEDHKISFYTKFSKIQ